MSLKKRGLGRGLDALLGSAGNVQLVISKGWYFRIMTTMTMTTMTTIIMMMMITTMIMIEMATITMIILGMIRDQRNKIPIDCK